ncbi:alpha/beta hydrolase [Herbiconiux sp. UC225_62]|uniref:alpha/beta hydrolase n=1 Tax=Herbiconiux sp. UC225_62 TaxID=3350168 RepID=UPI0036D413E5
MADPTTAALATPAPTSAPAGLDPDVARLLPALNAAAPPVGPGTRADELRTSFGELLALLAPEHPAEPFAGRVDDGVVEAAGIRIPIRSWTPGGEAGGGDTVVFFHGGGWVLGDLASAEPSARAIAERMRVRVVAVDYRLAPEHPFPAAFDDCLAVLRAERERGAGWLAVAGDSAGGNLAAAVALAARDSGLRLDAQLLFYPALDPSMRAASHARFGDGYLLTADAMRYYWASYAAGSRDAEDWRCSPGAADSLAGVAPAVVTTAGFDPLRDEGDEYAARLVADRVATVSLPEPALIHGWIDQAARVPAARRALDRALDALQLLRTAARAEAIS